MVNIVYLLLKLHVLCALTVSSVGKENKTEKAAKKGGRKVKRVVLVPQKAPLPKIKVCNVGGKEDLTALESRFLKGTFTPFSEDVERVPLASSENIL